MRRATGWLPRLGSNAAPRFILPPAARQAVAHELKANQTATTPPGLMNRVREMSAPASQGWPDQVFALELDERSPEAVHAVHAPLSGENRRAGQEGASVAEAMRIVHNHQERD